jgi:hypothetical protein
MGRRGIRQCTPKEWAADQSSKPPTPFSIIGGLPGEAYDLRDDVPNTLAQVKICLGSYVRKTGRRPTLVLYADRYSFPAAIEFHDFGQGGKIEIEAKMCRGLLGIYVTGEEDPAWLAYKRPRV